MSRPTDALQQQMLVVLAMHGREAAALDGIIEPSHFDGHYAEIARRLLLHRRTHRESPGEGLWSLFTDLRDSEAWPVYLETLEGIIDHRRRVAPRHVVDEAGRFIRHAGLREAVMEAAAIIQSGNDVETLERAEAVLARIRDGSSEGADGLDFGDASVWDAIEDEDGIPLDIKALDRGGLGPRRGQLLLLIAPAKTGKSFFGTHVAKQAALLGRSVAFITLEISERLILRRIHSALFGISRRREDSRVARLVTTGSGRLTGIEEDLIEPALAADDPDFRAGLDRELRKWGDRLRIRVKEFPGGSLTAAGLESWLHGQAARDGFRPDVVVVDYADLMRLGIENYRLEVERLYVDLRAIAQRWNCAMVTMSQANREGARARGGVGVHHVAEAWGKVAAADTVLTLSRTASESSLRMARLTVAASRVDADGTSALISQDYARGQFVMDEARWSSSAARMAGEMAESGEDGGGLDS